MLTVSPNAFSVIIRTEVWTTRKGVVSKAVIRDSKGRFLGATNQTKVYLVDIQKYVFF